MSVPESVDRVLLTAAVVVITIAGAGLLTRIWRGPSMLDRAISLDVCAALIIAGLGAKSAFARDPFYFPIMLVLAFLGFTGSVGIARFIAVRDRPALRRGADETESSDGRDGNDGREGEAR
ncbi:monovalent cation/H+ antiporter complex subunit F [Streptomyces sp. BE133]|uniref:monovalent cation/H+ antiporter complex subunit F n=1 Tax=Streptomyces sp. BE133 TaxID=3002523 RepID=UPI002E785F10|nr:monovalent cation/H+ antiporter complex subunit F [Streptomyces sp. BE133]MEE1809419.1 monovalent cation/H+ antiporter complex subunit F [Streptomyces sp. BE133]